MQFQYNFLQQANKLDIKLYMGIQFNTPYAFFLGVGFSEFGMHLVVPTFLTFTFFCN